MNNHGAVRYLITGGAGFIGSHLSEHLLRLGHHVTVIDDLSTGSIRNISHLRENRGFRYVIGNMNETPLLAELVDDADAVFHLAAAVGVKLIVESPVRTLETNIRCTELLLEIAAKKKRRVLVASTSEVYGKSTAIPFHEDGDLVLGSTMRGRWSYACSKAIDEFLAIAYWREKKLPATIARLFNTVGPRQSGQYGMVIPRFVQQALAGEDITVYGDGTQRRCFSHVTDVVDALTRLMDSSETIGKVFNVGSQEEISVLELAERVVALTGSNSRIRFIPFEVAYDSDFEDMPRRIPCLDRIAGAVSWTPTRNLETILTDVIASESAQRQMALV